ncbi:hypothetical protein HZA40_01770 [Candidatus Peregrinibacteria bacterium]|nr:hypothetical protein [Candidatus Peregrinibacteria bacterium]
MNRKIKFLVLVAVVLALVVGGFYFMKSGGGGLQGKLQIKQSGVRATAIQSITITPIVIDNAEQTDKNGQFFVSGKSLVLEVIGQNLAEVKSIKITDSSISVDKESGYPINQKGNLIIDATAAISAQSGTKTAVFTMTDNTTKSVDFYLDFSIMPKPPVWINPDSSKTRLPTLSLSSPILAWDTGDTFQSEMYKFVNGSTPEQVYQYKLEIISPSNNFGVMATDSSDKTILGYDTCFQKLYYGSASINTAIPHWESGWVCNLITLSPSTVRKLTVGQTYQASLSRATYKGSTFTGNVSEIMFKVVK